MTPFILTPNVQPIALPPRDNTMDVLNYPAMNEIGYVFGFSHDQAGN